MGGNFAEGRGNAVLSVEYNEQEGLLTSDRFSFYRQLKNPTNTGPADGIPGQRVVAEYGYGSITEGGLPMAPVDLMPGLPLPPGAITPAFPNGNYIFDASANPLKFGPNGTLVPLNRGTPVGKLSFGAPTDVSGGDRLDPARHRTLVAPSQRTLLNGVAHYDLTPWARAFIEAAYANTEGVEMSEMEAFAAPTLTGTAVTVSVNNPFLPQQSRHRSRRASLVTSPMAIAPVTSTRPAASSPARSLRPNTALICRRHRRSVWVPRCFISTRTKPLLLPASRL